MLLSLSSTFYGGYLWICSTGVTFAFNLSFCIISSYLVENTYCITWLCFPIDYSDRFFLITLSGLTTGLTSGDDLNSTVSSSKGTRCLYFGSRFISSLNNIGLTIGLARLLKTFSKEISFPF
jgi:hypothetical protein